MLTYDKNFILTMLQLRSKVLVLWDGLTQIQFDIQSVFHTLKLYLLAPSTQINKSPKLTVSSL